MYSNEPIFGELLHCTDYPNLGPNILITSIWDSGQWSEHEFDKTY